MTQYIDKSAVVAEIERRQKEEVFYDEDGSFASFGDQLHYSILESIKNFIDTLETKEGDLDFQRFAKEMEIIFALPSSKTKNTEEEPLNWEYAIAKHFYELGLKAQKGE